MILVGRRICRYTVVALLERGFDHALAVRVLEYARFASQVNFRPWLERGQETGRVRLADPLEKHVVPLGLDAATDGTELLAEICVDREPFILIVRDLNGLPAHRAEHGFQGMVEVRDVALLVDFTEVTAKHGGVRLEQVDATHLYH